MARATCSHSPERVPGAMPARLPADDTSWQGKPAVSTSTGSTWVQSTAVMSPWLGTSGQWRARMRAVYWFLSGRPLASGGSYWQYQAVSAPSTCSAARSSPP